jgi:hypothetical protein
MGDTIKNTAKCNFEPSPRIDFLCLARNLFNKKADGILDFENPSLNNGMRSEVLPRRDSAEQIDLSWRYANHSLIVALPRQPGECAYAQAQQGPPKEKHWSPFRCHGQSPSSSKR